MASIILDGVSVHIPVYNARSRSLKVRMLAMSTGPRNRVRTEDRISIPALAGVTFELGEGDRLGLVGSNGAGKTTLLRVLAGVYEPTGGTVRRQGAVASLFDLFLGMDPEMTGYENILLRGALLGVPWPEIKARQDEIAAFTELGGHLDLPVRTYSAGMRLRLAFAISTAAVPDILLMDEWLSVGDANFVKKAQDRMERLVGNTRILVLASHSTALIRRVCNRALWLDRGAVREAGSVEGVIGAYEEWAASPAVMARSD